MRIKVGTRYFSEELEEIAKVTKIEMGVVFYYTYVQQENFTVGEDEFRDIYPHKDFQKEFDSL